MIKTQHADIRIEYPSTGTTYCRMEFGVYTYSKYARGSVLSGRTRRVFEDSFETLEEARAAYPDATFANSCGFIRDSFSDLPGEGSY